MEIDNAQTFNAESPDQWALLELKQPLYIGGVPEHSQIPDTLSATSGFVINTKI